MLLKARSWTFWQCAVCLGGLTASAVPVLPRTGAFWGILRSWTSITPNCVVVSQVEPGSPAEKIGLQGLDRIDVVNGHTFSAAEQFDGLIGQISSKSPLELKIRRPTAELQRMIAEGKITIDLNKTKDFEALENRLTLRGTSAVPEIEAVMYYVRQFAAASIFAAVGVFVAATDRFRGARWRPPTVIAVALASMVLIPLLIPPWASTLVWRRWLVHSLPRPWIPLIVCPSAGLALLFLAFFEIRGVSRR